MSASIFLVRTQRGGVLASVAYADRAEADSAALAAQHEAEQRDGRPGWVRVVEVPLVGNLADIARRAAEEPYVPPTEPAPSGDGGEVAMVTIVARGGVKP